LRALLEQRRDMQSMRRGQAQTPGRGEVAGGDLRDDAQEVAELELEAAVATGTNMR